jgi:hypothetical protein
MALSGVVRHGALHSVTSQKSRKILHPGTKLCGTHAPGVISGVIKNTKDVVGENLCYRLSHTSETGQEKVDRISTEEIERCAGALGRVSPRIIMIQHVD